MLTFEFCFISTYMANKLNLLLLKEIRIDFNFKIRPADEITLQLQMK